MSKNADDGLDLSAVLYQQDEMSSPPLHDLYGELVKLDNLRLAYVQVKSDSPSHGIDTLPLETVEDVGVEGFLQQLSCDLQSRIYQPREFSNPAAVENDFESPGMIAFRDHVVQAALKAILEPIFPADLPCDPEPEKAIKWVGATIERGLTRVYAVQLEECFDAEQQERLLEKVSQRLGDPEIVALLKTILASLGQQDSSQRTVLAPLLANIAFQEIDHMLQKAKALGREGTIVHFTYARFGDDLIILCDQDSRYDWLQPAVQKHLREELTALQYSMNHEETQLVDLARGERLRFLGFELRRVAGSQGDARVQYKRPKRPRRRALKNALPSWHLPRYFPRLEFARRCWHRIPRLPPCGQSVQDAYRKVSSIQFGWRHLPITLFPFLAFYFGWRSPWPSLCAALIVVCNWRSLPAVVLWAWRHRWGVATTTCGLAGCVCLYLLISDFYANLSHETPATSMPPGFYRGQYRGDSWWPTETIPGTPYGLYVPPHFQKQQGPFPLIVFLHGYGERDPRGGGFTAQLPKAIAHRVSKDTSNGAFEFVAFFPVNPTGNWQPESPEVENVMKTLNYVIARHYIDPKRIYLTGISAGGDGVWNLAQTYPDKWAAVAPVSAFIQPDVQKVRHIPAWIFHGDEDKLASVDLDRDLVQKLKAVGADVHYTEAAGKGHANFPVYNVQELYDWFATKRRED